MQKKKKQFNKENLILTNTSISVDVGLQSERGFTLVELIVSLALFTIVIMISMGAMLSMSDTNRQVKTMRVAMDNLNLTLESMSRSIRMGSVYTCNPTIPLTLSYNGSGVNCGIGNGGGTSFAFLSQDNNFTMVYRLNNSVIQRSENGGNSFSDITAPNIKINSFKFYVLGAGAGNRQPHIIISIMGTVSGKFTRSFRMQTTVTQRLPK